MIRSTATIAIVTTRLAKERRVLALATAACALLGFLLRYDDAPARLAGSLVFGTLIGIAIALLQRGSGRFRELELCEQSAPLYGRELARATALVPCLIVTFAVAAFWSVNALYATPQVSEIAVCALAVYAATLVALSAGVRTGFWRIVYVAMACAVPAVAFALAVTWRAPAALILCAITGFIALRQYGEALARYDPV